MKKKTVVESDRRQESAAPPAADGPVAQVVLLPVANLKLHPAATKVPGMRPEEWEAFLKDVKQVGVQTPILVVRQGDDYQVLDGRHRLKATRLRDDTVIPAIVVELSEAEQVGYVLRTALLRRHLTDDQRAVLAARWCKVEQQKAKQERARQGGRKGGRGRKKTTPDSSAHTGDAELSGTAAPLKRAPRAADRAAEDFGLSKKKVRKALEVEVVAPELSEQVLAGEATLREAACEADRRQGKAAPLAGGPPAAASEPPDAVVIPLTADLKSFAGLLLEKFGRDQADELSGALRQVTLDDLLREGEECRRKGRKK